MARALLLALEMLSDGDRSIIDQLSAPHHA